MDDDVTRALARHVSESLLDDTSEDARRLAKEHILDCLGVAVGGSASPAGLAVLAMTRSLSEGGTATLLGSGLRASVVSSAWANGTFAHLLDFDDTGFSHPSACIVPAGLAMAEHTGASGADLLMGIIAGYEVFERLASVGRPHEPALRARGFHPTALYGCAAAAASAGRVAGLNGQQMAVAIGLALTNAAGLNEQHGTWGKGVHAGNAARAGVVGVLLGQQDYWASDRILEARYGFYRAVFGDQPLDLARVAEPFGSTWAIVEPGLNIKPYPACGRALRAIDAALELRRDLAFEASDIDHVVVDAFPDYVHTLPQVAPTVGFRGKFSLDYCVAVSLLDGSVGLTSFDDESAKRPALRELLRRIEIAVHEDWDPERRRENPVTVFLRDGSSHTRVCNSPRGSVRNRLRLDEFLAKFVDCLELAGIGGDDATAVSQDVLGLEGLPQAASLVGRLTTAQS